MREGRLEENQSKDRPPTLTEHKGVHIGTSRGGWDVSLEGSEFICGLGEKHMSRRGNDGKSKHGAQMEHRSRNEAISRADPTSEPFCGCDIRFVLQVGETLCISMDNRHLDHAFCREHSRL